MSLIKLIFSTLFKKKIEEKIEEIQRPSIQREMSLKSADDVKMVQTSLSRLGYLDPPSDGEFGPTSSWALHEFLKTRGVVFDGSISIAMADALQTAPPLPLDLTDNDLASKILRLMNAKGHWIARHSACVNITYVEGMNPDGTLNDDSEDKFNDLRNAIRIGSDGKPIMLGSWHATTRPGKYWRTHRMNPAGAANIVPGQYKAWMVGVHNNSHEALVQRGNVSVARDDNEDFRREGDKIYTDKGYGINQHNGYNLPLNSLGRSSAGCLVGQSVAGHQKFMSIVKTDARYVNNRGYMFMTSVLVGREIR